MTTDIIKDYFVKYKVGVECYIDRIAFQPKGKDFLVTINKDIVNCSKYADKDEAEEVVCTIQKMLQ